jgi:signal transduction histidine kinase
MDSTRQLIFETRPWTLDESAGQLSERIAEYARRFADRTGVTVTVDADPALDSVPQSTAFAILRVMQESLNNAAKHAQAQSISIRAVCVDNEVRLTIVDDGRGFDPAKLVGDGIGLKSMRERAEALRGRLQIDTADGHGVTISLTVPLR